MPKERVKDHTTDGWHIELSWRPEEGNLSGHVQLASVNVHSPFEFPEEVGPDSWKAAEPFDGWRVTLDEDGIDRLIKTLHKAKRQAFPPATPLGPPQGMQCTARAHHVDLGWQVCELESLHGGPHACGRWRWESDALGSEAEES